MVLESLGQLALAFPVKVKYTCPVLISSTLGVYTGFNIALLLKVPKIWDGVLIPLLLSEAVQIILGVVFA
jgi:hypothetical protein